MQTIGILGAGELGAGIARRLAERELARRVVLVDPDAGKAKGKALDIAQAGPVEGFDTRVEGCASPKEAGRADVWIAADPPDLAERSLGALRAGDFVRELLPELGQGIFLVAGAHAPALVEAARRRGVPRERVLGSAPVAYAAALRRRLAAELKVEATSFSVTLLGLPPEHIVLPRGSATLGGIPVEVLSAVASRRALEGLRKREAGPLALAAAAVEVLAALTGARESVLPVVAALEGEYGHRGLALAVPARLGGGRLQSVVEFPLDPVDRVALDTAAQRRLEASAP